MLLLSVPGKGLSLQTGHIMRILPSLKSHRMRITLPVCKGCELRQTASSQCWIYIYKRNSYVLLE